MDCFFNSSGVGVFIRWVERGLFSKQNVKMVFFPTQDITLRFISLQQKFSAPIDQIYSNVCMRTTMISSLPESKSLAAEKVHLAFITEKNHVPDFFEGQWQAFVFCRYTDMEDALFLNYFMDIHWIQQCAVIFSARTWFSASFPRTKRDHVFEFYRRKVTDLLAYSLSKFWHPFSPNAFVGTLCLMLTCIAKVLIDLGRKFRLPKLSSWQDFGENKWKPRFFPGSKSHFFALFRPNISAIPFDCCLTA